MSVLKKHSDCQRVHFKSLQQTETLKASVCLKKQSAWRGWRPLQVRSITLYKRRLHEEDQIKKIKKSFHEHYINIINTVYQNQHSINDKWHNYSFAAKESLENMTINFCYSCLSISSICSIVCVCVFVSVFPWHVLCLHLASGVSATFFFCCDLQLCHFHSGLVCSSKRKWHTLPLVVFAQLRPSTTAPFFVFTVV